MSNETPNDNDNQQQPPPAEEQHQQQEAANATTTSRPPTEPPTLGTQKEHDNDNDTSIESPAPREETARLLGASGGPVTVVLPPSHRPDVEEPTPWYYQGREVILPIVGKSLLTLIGPYNWLPSYTPLKLRSDFIGGLVVAVMVIPQSLAYSNLAGLPAEYGLYAGMMGAFFYSLFGAVPMLAVGPVALLSILTKGMTETAETDAEKVAIAMELALLSGIVLIIFSICQLGIITRFVPHAVTSAFATGAAVLILLSQFSKFFAIKVATSHNLIEYIIHIIEGFGNDATINSLWIFLFGLAFTLYLLAMRNLPLPPWIPHQLFCVIVSTLITWLARLDEKIKLPIVGALPFDPPPIAVPKLSHFGEYLPHAVIMAVVGFLESYSVAKKFCDDRGVVIGGNKELFALGMSNVWGSFFGSYAVTGSITRTAVANTLGTQSPLFSFLQAIVVLIVLLGFNRLDVFFYTPKVILGAIIVAACSGMFDHRTARHLFHANKGDFAVWVATVVAVLGIGVELGIVLGVVIAFFHVLVRLAMPSMPEIGIRRVRLTSDGCVKKLDGADEGDQEACAALVAVGAAERPAASRDEPREEEEEEQELLGEGSPMSPATEAKVGVLPPAAEEGIVFRDIYRHQNVQTFENIVILRFDAPLFFVNAQSLITRVDEIYAMDHHSNIYAVVLNCEGITYSDVTGCEILAELVKTLAKKRKPACELLLACVKPQFKNALKASDMWGYTPLVAEDGSQKKRPFRGKETAFATVADALVRAHEVVAAGRIRTAKEERDEAERAAREEEENRKREEAEARGEVYVAGNEPTAEAATAPPPVADAEDNNDETNGEEGARLAENADGGKEEGDGEEDDGAKDEVLSIASTYTA